MLCSQLSCGKQRCIWTSFSGAVLATSWKILHIKQINLSFTDLPPVTSWPPSETFGNCLTCAHAVFCMSFTTPSQQS